MTESIPLTLARGLLPSTARRLGLPLLATLLLCAVPPAHARAADPLNTLLTGAEQGGAWQPPTREALETAEALFTRLLKGETGPDLAAAWRAQGFDLRPLALDGETLLLLSEQPAARQGRGLYLFRSTPAPRALQIPHARDDELTGRIGLEWLRDPRIQAAAFNTLRRTQVDLAHTPDTHFTAFARAFARVHPQGSLLQLHGFEPRKRKAPAARAASAILSAGTATPSAQLERFAACLRPLLPGLRIYPTEVRDLGATDNVSGAALRALGHPGFLHLELDPDVRGVLAQEPARVRRFSGCLP